MFTLVSTLSLFGPTSSTANLAWAFTHPPGTAPTGTFSKSCLYGSWATTRTRARALMPPLSYSTYPCWLPGCGATVRVPSSSLPARAGGCAPAGVFGGSGSDQFAGGDGRLSFTVRPLASK